MDIAICVSGQLISNWKQCLDSWKESFSQHSVTWFGHTWTTKSAPNWHKNKSKLDKLLMMLVFLVHISNNPNQSLLKNILRIYYSYFVIETITSQAIAFSFPIKPNFSTVLPFRLI